MSRRKKITLSIILVVVALVLFGVIEFISIIQELPHPEKITSFQPTQSTKIYDRTGEVLLYEIHGDQNRTIIPADQIPLFARQATIAAEDQGFYKHSAFDIKGFTRAVFVNLYHGSFVQGGSTITQQLVKNVFLTPEKTIRRKVKELILSYWIENQYSKDEVLTMYMNQIHYGSNSYGIESASQRFFGKSAKDISIAQSAVLAALIKSPSYYSPWGSHIKELSDRKLYVLKEMFSLGYISQEQYDAARNEDVKFLAQNIGTIRAPHFSVMIKDYLSQKYGDDLVDRGGLKVVTTLDWNKQQVAERVVKEGAANNAKAYSGKNAALVAEDPKTGQILALVGSADYFDQSINGNFNVVTQGLRQPGSTFKPIVYLAAFIKGYLPQTILFDTRTNFNTTGDSKYNYIPENFDGLYRGPMSLRNALAQSINVPAVKLLYLVGIKPSLEMAQTLGIQTLTDPSRYGLSLVLGGGETKLIELLRAYSIFAQEGVDHTQSFILSVKDSRGNTLEEFSDHATRVVEQQPVRMLNSILSDPEPRTELFHASINLTKFDDRQVAIKTGTTNDYRDAWTIGYTPSLVVGVWAGNSNNAPMQKQGGSVLAALPIWSAFMKEVINSYPVEEFTKPEEVISSVPMVNGTYITQSANGQKEVHSILYYIDKNNPTQTPPAGFSPYLDPQFMGWESSVSAWGQQNIQKLTNTP